MEARLHRGAGPARRPHALLDLAGGTGDITTGWARRGGGPAILSDINAAMLGVGRDRVTEAGLLTGIDFLVADAEQIRCPTARSIGCPWRSACATARIRPRCWRRRGACCGPAGSFWCLEFSKLQVAALERVYDAWSFQALPRIGGIVAQDAASYQYLAESIRMFPDQDTLAGMMQAAGLERVSFRNLSGGIAAIHQGWRL